MNILKLSIIIYFSILYFFTALAQVSPKSSIEIESFDSIPSSIEGGCCMFFRSPSKGRNSGHIMVNDLATTAYMVINHHFEEFYLVANRTNVFWYKNKKFNLKVIIGHTINKGYGEFYNVKGLLIVEDHNKNRQKLAFYGDCSW